MQNACNPLRVLCVGVASVLAVLVRADDFESLFGLFFDAAIYCRAQTKSFFFFSFLLIPKKVATAMFWSSKPDVIVVGAGLAGTEGLVPC